MPSNRTYDTTYHVLPPLKSLVAMARLNKHSTLYNGILATSTKILLYRGINMIILYTLHYNNYYNRNLKKEETLQNYLDQDFWTNGHETDNVSFNPADGVDTTQLISYNADNDDYAILARVVDGEETILSRWFIMEARRTRTNQYLLTLKRDVLVDNYELIKNDPVFVEKGMLEDNDPMICNDEGMKFNQIKVREEMIVSKDFGDGADTPYEEVPWLLAYVKKGTLTNHVISIDTEDKEEDTYTLAEVASDISCTTQQLRNYLRLPNEAQPTGRTYGNEVHINFGVKEYTKFDLITIPYYEGRKVVYTKDWYDTFTDHVVYSSSDIIFDVPYTSVLFDAKVKLYFGFDKNRLKTITTRAFEEYMLNWNQIDKLKSYVGKKIVVDNVVYKVNSVRENPSNVWLDRPLANDDSSIAYITENIRNTAAVRIENGVYHISTQPNNIYLELENTTSGNVTIDLQVSGQTRNSTANCVCDIIAIPFANTLTGKTSSGIFQSDIFISLTKEQLYRIACKFSETLGGECYDVQLVPYVNIRTQYGCYNSHEEQEYIYRPVIDMDGMVEGKDFVKIKKSNNTVGYAYFLNTANIQTYRNLYIPVDNPKIESQTDFIRLVSSTGASIYEMNPAKNGGLSILNITGTLKPYNTYYKITPNFGFLYGQNFDKDPRGLIIQDNFSLTQVSDAWTQYALQNKNYQQIFNRGLQSLDLEQAITRQEAPLKAIAGATGATAGGAVAGFKATGSPYGAIAGAAVGLTAGVAGGAIDLTNIDKRLKDQRDLQIQNFNYQLGNIIARPDTITKTDTFNVDSKLLPYVEYYSCTDAEKKALQDKITYDGMTVMRIGNLKEFENMGGFFKGQYIKNLNNSFNGDNHMLESINTELMKGVYL